MVKAMIAGSLTARTNRRSGIRAMSAAGTSATSANTISAPYSVATSRPRFRSTWIPLWLTVTAIAAPMPIGAYFMTMPTNLNITSVSPSQNPSIDSCGLPRTWRERDGEQRGPEDHLEHLVLAPRPRRSCWGTMCSRNPPNVVGRGLGDRRVGVRRRRGSRPRPAG